MTLEIDFDHYELYERTARGWNLNLETALSQHVALKMGWSSGMATKWTLTVAAILTDLTWGLKAACTTGWGQRGAEHD